MNAPHFTSADLDALSGLVATPGYKIVRDRVELELERRRIELERMGYGLVNSAECRGRIAALRTVLKIPEILRDEMKTQIARNDKDGD